MAEELEQAEEHVEATEEVADSPEQVEPNTSEESQEVAGDYNPEWLDESGDEPVQQGPSQEELAAYYRQMAAQQGYPQQQMPQQPQESDLDKLVKDTRGYVSSIAQQHAQQIAQNVMAQQFGPYAQQMQRFMEGQAKTQASNADKSVRNMYKEVFNKDEQFVGNTAVRKRVEGTLRNMRNQALQQAQMGDYSALNMFNEPGFAQVALQAAKIVEGLNPSSSTPVATPHTERTAPASREKKSYWNELDPDTQEGYRSIYGVNAESRYNKARAEEDKYQDFS